MQRKEGTTRTQGSMAHVSALGLVFLLYYSMLQQMGVEAKAWATKEDWVNTTACMPGTYDQKIFIDDKKTMLIPTQVARDLRGGNQQVKAPYAPKLMVLFASKGLPVSMSACEEITSSVSFLFSEEARLSKWLQIRVLRIEKISIATLKDVVVLTQFSSNVHGG